MLISLIPPVTIGGRNAPIVANLFDDSGNFRQRNGSFKRLKVGGAGTAAREGFYDLSRDAVAPTIPTVLKLDVRKIQGLMVKANEAATVIRSRIVSGMALEEVRELAGFSVSLLDLISAVVEEGILAMASSTAVTFASDVGAPAANIPAPSRSQLELGTAELKAALAAAEKTAVVFDTDLGWALVANWATLNSAFAAGLKAATVKVANKSGGDANKSIRIVNDVLSCADNLDFIG
jgi:hypothetical protein